MAKVHTPAHMTTEHRGVTRGKTSTSGTTGRSVVPVATAAPPMHRGAIRGNPTAPTPTHGGFAHHPAGFVEKKPMGKIGSLAALNDANTKAI